MAITVERMVAVLEARMDKFEKGVERARKQAVGDFAAITTAGSDMEKSINGLAANSNKAFGAGAKGAQQFQKSIGGARAETGNLAAQLNDIGVQLAGGQSPFLIAIQQGSQINQVLGQAGARGAIGALAGAFTSLINPVSLATIAIIAGGGAAIQYFSGLLSGTDEAKPALEEQEKLIRSLAERWGEVIPPLKEYVQELDRAKTVAEAQQGGTILADVQWGKVRDELASFNDEYEEYITAITIAGNATGTQRTALSEFGSAYVDLASKIESGTATQEDFDRARAAATQAAAMEGAEELGVFVTALDKLNAALDSPLEKLRQIQPLLTGQARMLDPGTWRGVGANPNGFVSSIQGGFQTPEIGPTPDSRPLIELEGLPGASKKAKGGGRDSAAEKIKREKEAVVDLIEQLEFEQSMIGATDAERAEANALRRAGAAATEEQKSRISELVEATYAERDALKSSQEAMKELQAVGRDVLEGIVSDMREGKKGADILANALGRIADKLLSSALDGLFSGGVGGIGGAKKGGIFGGSIIPGILHSGGVAGQDGYGHGRSVSTSVFAGARRYHTGGIAGLQAGEVPAILQKGEVVLPRNTKTGSGSISAPISIAIDARGADEAGLVRVERQIAALKASLPGTVVRTVKDAQARRKI